MKKFLFSFGEAHDLKSKQYVMDDQGYCTQILTIAFSQTGKHGHIKCTIEGRRLETNEKVNLMMPGHSRVITVEPITETFQMIDWELNDNDYEDVHITVLDESCNEQHYNVDLSDKRFASFRINHQNWRNEDVEICLFFYPFVSKLDQIDNEDMVEERYYVENSIQMILD